METENKPAPVKDKFIKVGDKLPPVKSHGSVASSSVMLSLKLKGGKIVSGQYQRWDRDMNAPHLTAKKGDGFFYGTDRAVLSNVEGWSL